MTEPASMFAKHMVVLMIVALSQTSEGHATPVVPRQILGRSTSHHRCGEDRELRKIDCSRREFDSVPQNLPEDIKGLNLWLNNITSLKSSSFVRYPLITELNLSHNRIRRIDNTTFYPLKDLKYLDMGQNTSPVLPSPDPFRWATKLSYLLLSSSYMGSIPDGILKWSRNLDTLDLRSNSLKRIHLSLCGRVRHADLSRNNIDNLTVEAFKFGCQADILDLTYNLIQSVDPKVIASLDVQWLQLGNHPLTEDVLRDIFIGISRSVTTSIKALVLRDYSLDFSVIPTYLFDPLRDYPLTMLDLSRNRIHDLHPFIFSNLTRLHQLNLSNNNISTIEPNFFEGMRELRILNLNYNKVKYINRYTDISWTIYLTELHLSENLLTKINESTFGGLHNLKLLNMTSNKLLSTVRMNNLRSIENIDLSYCNIATFKLIFQSFTSLSINKNINSNMFFLPRRYFIKMWFREHLSLRQSHVWFERLYNSFKNFSVFDGLVNLKTLDLSDNHKAYNSRQVLHPGVFRQLSALENLTLETCDLENMDRLTFVRLDSLMVLVLRDNDLHQLHVDLFKELQQLARIDLSLNSLVEINQSLFSHNPNLTTLLLSKNKLTHLDHNTFRPIYSSLSSIDLSSNPIVCDCDLLWFINWLHGSLHLVENEQSQTSCSPASLAPLRDKHLLDFVPKEFCGTNVTLVCLSSLAVICVILILAVGYHNRWQLRYKLFLVKLAAIGYREERDARDHNDYEFDLNIIYYDDDVEWIRDHLQPAIEERLPQFQRNLFGDEDLVLGMHYLDSVDYVVTHSYKTVIVLSTTAVRDRWYMLKFRTAMDHVSDTQTEFVVVVFVEDIPDEEIPFLARLYLSDGRPYLFWPDDVRGHEYFFEELTKHLTINLRTNDLIPNE